MDVQSMFRFLVEVPALKDETRPDPKTPAYGLATFGCGKTALSGRMAMDITENSLRGNTDLVVRGYHDHPHYQVPTLPPEAQRAKRAAVPPETKSNGGNGPFPPYLPPACGRKVPPLAGRRAEVGGRDLLGLEAQAALVGASPPPRLLRRRYSPHPTGGGRDEAVAGTPPSLTLWWER
jgi:hypothetical protein